MIGGTVDGSTVGGGGGSKGRGGEGGDGEGGGDEGGGGDGGSEGGGGDGTCAWAPEQLRAWAVATRGGWREWQPEGECRKLCAISMRAPGTHWSAAACGSWVEPVHLCFEFSRCKARVVDILESPICTDGE